MGQPRKQPVMRVTTAEQQMRDREVLRANKDLAAYFKGDRTEREARAALKIIKAFVRDRERRDAGSRRPLPGAQAVGASAVRRRQAAATDEMRRSRTRRPKAAKRESTRPAASVDAPVDSGSGPSPAPIARPGE